MRIVLVLVLIVFSRGQSPLTQIVGNTPIIGDGLPAREAGILPSDLFVDGALNIYIASAVDVGGSFTNNRIRVVNGNTSIITTVAGGGNSLSENIPATSSSLGQLSAVTVDASGNIYIAISSVHKVQMVSKTAQILSTICGTGLAAFGGDGGPASAAALNSPQAIALDSSNNLFIADTGNNRIRFINRNTGIITTVAGGGVLGDGSLATAASLNQPSGIALDSLGNLYIADRLNHNIRLVTTVSGIISTVAGVGAAGFSGDGGLAVSAVLNQPSKVKVDLAGNIYIADKQNFRIRIVDPSGFISTIAGNGSSGPFIGEGGLATSAALGDVSSFCLDASGNIYIALSANLVVLVNRTTNIISSIVGNGVTHFAFGDGLPAANGFIISISGMGTDPAGNVFIADYVLNSIRMLNKTSGIISTIAGQNTKFGFHSGDGGPSVLSNLFGPADVRSDKEGNIYIAEADGHRIRMVNMTTRIITTVVGTGVAGLSGDGGLATLAQINNPITAVVDSVGNIYVSDQINCRIRLVNRATGIISTFAGSSCGVGVDGIPAASSFLAFQRGIFLDKDENLFIADLIAQRIRKITSDTKTIFTVAGIAGTITGGFSGDGGPATSANLFRPFAVSVDTFGNILIADTNNFRFRFVNASTNVITTIVGPGGAVADLPAAVRSIEAPSIFTDGLDTFIPSFGVLLRFRSCLAESDCQNGIFCDGREICKGGFCFPASQANPCVGNSICSSVCNETLQACMAVDGTACQDGTCSQGKCLVTAVTAPPTQSSSNLLGLIAIPVILIAIVAAILGFLCYKRKFGSSKAGEFDLEDIRASDRPKSSHLLEKVSIGQKIGHGNFGVVYLGEHLGTKVAVKSMSLREDLLQKEFALVKNLSHPNLVSYQGLCLGPNLETCIVMEYCEFGSLFDYVKRLKDEMSGPNRFLALKHVAFGMRFLAQNKIIHRDLALRNVLVSAVSPELVVKVADFGLSRAMAGEEYSASTKKMPIRWTAIEGLTRQAFTLKSDVWSFGVLMWELYSNGAEPYEQLANDEVIQKLSKEKGFRLTIDKSWPEHVRKLMMQCWAENPDERPSFKEITDALP